MRTTIQEMKSDFANFGDVVTYLSVGEEGNLSKSLQCISLYINIVDTDRSKQAINDKVSLFFNLEILACTWYGPLERLHCNLGKLDMILVYVADCCVEYLTNLSLL